MSRLRHGLAIVRRRATRCRRFGGYFPSRCGSDERREFGADIINDDFRRWNHGRGKHAIEQQQDEYPQSSAWWHNSKCHIYLMSVKPALKENDSLRPRSAAVA